MSNSARKIAEYVRDAGGRTYYVGGFVRDRILMTGDSGNLNTGRSAEPKDVDIEVHGISPELLHRILEKVGEPLSYGKSFGVFSLTGENIDIAMPRRERAVGTGHRDFEIDVDPCLGTWEAARRRDFTINSLMEDVLTGEIVDHFGGLRDLEAGVIRHIDPDTFIEDPLRVLRAAQFAARFGFAPDPQTTELCRSIDISTLPRERVCEELKKALLLTERPSVFFEVLREMDQLSCWFPELEALIGVQQDPIYHPEGDVWTHTMEVADRAASYRDKVSEPFRFMLLALTHDLGKAVTSEEINGRIHAYGHEIAGLPLAESFVSRLTGEKEVIRYIRNMVPLHMKPNMQAFSRPAVKKTNRMFDAAAEPEDLVYFAAADRPLRVGNEVFTGDNVFLRERLEVYREIMSRPYVKGRDLVEAGLRPGEDFGEILSYAHKLRLAGIEKKPALKQVLAYARQIRKGK